MTFTNGENFYYSYYFIYKFSFFKISNFPHHFNNPFPVFFFIHDVPPLLLTMQQNHFLFHFCNVTIHIIHYPVSNNSLFFLKIYIIMGQYCCYTLEKFFIFIPAIYSEHLFVNYLNSIFLTFLLLLLNFYPICGTIFITGEVHHNGTG